MTDTSDKELQVKAVLFDLGGTLVHTSEIPEVYKRILQAHGIKRSLQEISRAQEETERHLDIQDLAVLFEEYWIRWNFQILNRLGVKENVDFLAETITREWWNYSEIGLYPDVEETLRQLRGMGLKLGIVTNGLESDYRQILKKVDLLDSFDIIVGIDSVGRMKPHGGIFLHALDRLGVSPREAVFVGDEPVYDYAGAQKVGLRPLLIDRDGKITSKIKKIRSLNEIMDYLM